MRFINKHFFIHFIKKSIVLFAVLSAVLLFLIGCSTEAVPQDNEPGEIFDPNDVKIRQVSIIDQNGNDTYPGDNIAVIIDLENQGESKTGNIEIKLSTGINIDIPADGSLIDIGELQAGERKKIEVDAKIEDGIENDIIDSIGLDISIDGLSFYSNAEEINISGVKPYGRNKIPIIGLHEIAEEIEIPIELSTANFETLCSTLQDFGYETITFSDLLKHIRYGKALPDKAAIITSDDGYQGNYINAYPILKKYGFVMTVFLVTGAIAEDDSTRMNNTVFNKRTNVERPMLIWPEIKEMDDYGCEFLSHTENHIRLGLATDEEMLDELISSKQDIKEKLGKDVDFFAWPFDNYSEDKWPLIKEAGYEGAVRYWGGIEDINTLDLRNIKRIEFNSYISPSQYAGYLGLFNLSIDGSIKSGEIPEGEEFELEFVVKNNEDYVIDLSSIELELPEEIELLNMDQERSDIKQFPALDNGIFMWVGGDYSIGASSSIDIKMLLKANIAGEFPVKFRVTSYGSYIEADEISLEVIGD
jgi:peptidoglycan/xylan/chitin deacetylase (PgdA/CDA1 family)